MHGLFFIVVLAFAAISVEAFRFHGSRRLVSAVCVKSNRDVAQKSRLYLADGKEVSDTS
jgi:hypothetical protein